MTENSVSSRSPTETSVQGASRDQAGPGQLVEASSHQNLPEPNAARAWCAAKTRAHVVIVGAGFGGLAVARRLGASGKVDITVVDRRNHHLFQPLLYQVATAGLSPADIATPIRGLLAKYRSVRVVQGEVERIDAEQRRLTTDFGELDYDALVLATGARHAYFGHESWEVHAPGLKTIEQATEIRRRVLQAFELAERESDPVKRRHYLTFVVVGGGPTGVELAGAIGEMSRFTLARDFRSIDPKLTRIMLIEGGPRILASFPEKLATRATRDLESLGVQVWTGSRVTGVDAQGVEVEDEKISAATVLWAAGVRASGLGAQLPATVDRQGRVRVGPDTSVPGHPEIFVIGDLSDFRDLDDRPLPGVATVALQQGRFVADTLLRDLAGRPRRRFEYLDKGQMATIGRSRAILQSRKLTMTGNMAWLAWLFVHIYYLSGFRNRIFVLFSWAWSYMTFARGARLIVGKDWRVESRGTEAKVNADADADTGADAAGNEVEKAAG